MHPCRSPRHKPIPTKHLTPYQRGQVIGQQESGVPLSKISDNLKIPLLTVFDTVHKSQPDGQEEKAFR